MTESLGTAFLVLGVGMLTVFVILALVVFTGNILIKAVNRFAPGTPKVSAYGAKSFQANENSLHKSKLAAIVTAVEIATQGQGKIVSIKKV